MQFAIAQICLQLTWSYHRQLHLVAGGQGKSRIAALIALLALLVKKFSKVHLVFTNQRLMQKDKSDFAEVFAIAGLTEQVNYHVGIGFKVCDDELLILDEGDEHLYNDPGQAYTWLPGKYCILLTACVGGQREDESLESKVMSHFGFQIFNHMSTQEDKRGFDYDGIKLSDSEEIYDYLMEERKKQPILVYAETKCKNEVLSFQSTY